jgi:hypothetical protein
MIRQPNQFMDQSGPDLAQLSDDDFRKSLESALLIQKALDEPDKKPS